jgi:adenine-specific DNA-methyltransferase
LHGRNGSEVEEMSYWKDPFCESRVTVQLRATWFGRLAFVLPGALLHADYASPVRYALLRDFASVTALVLEDRIFDDAQEESILVLAKGFRQPGCSLRIATTTVQGLEASVCDLEQLGLSPQQCVASGKRWSRASLLSPSMAIYSRIAKDGIKLGRVADVRIGTVTGANDYFILTPSEARKRGISRKSTTPILTRSADLGLEFTSADIEKLLSADEKCLLLKGTARAESVQRYLRSGRRRKIHMHHKCRVRQPRHAVNVERRCDAFLRYMCADGPALTINRADVTCTNSLYALSWKQPVSELALSLAIQSTITQLSAEIEGRVLGGGLLKLEPSDALRLVVPPVVPKLLELADAVSNDSLQSVAIAKIGSIVDEVFTDVLYTRTELASLQSMLRRLRHMRRPARKSSMTHSP